MRRGGRIRDCDIPICLIQENGGEVTELGFEGGVVNLKHLEQNAKGEGMLAAYQDETWKTG